MEKKQLEMLEDAFADGDWVYRQPYNTESHYIESFVMRNKRGLEISVFHYSILNMDDSRTEEYETRIGGQQVAEAEAARPHFEKAYKRFRKQSKKVVEGTRIR